MAETTQTLTHSLEVWCRTPGTGQMFKIGLGLTGLSEGQILPIVDRVLAEDIILADQKGNITGFRPGAYAWAYLL